MLVFDRHDIITHALEIVFPYAYHGECYHHIIINVIVKFKTVHCHGEIYLSTYASRKSNFLHLFRKISVNDSAIAVYLEGIGFEK